MDELHRRVTRRIREIAKTRDILVTHLPDRSDVSRSHFFDVMAGKKSPTLEWLAKIASALDVDPGELFTKSKPHRG